MRHFNQLGFFFKLTQDQVLCSYLNIYICTDCLYAHNINTLSRSSFSSWDAEVAIKTVGAQEYSRVSRKGQVYKLSTLKFVPRRNKVSWVLIHLLSLIFHRHASQLRVNSMAISAMSDSSYVLLMKCSATGES